MTTCGLGHSITVGDDHADSKGYRGSTGKKRHRDNSAGSSQPELLKQASSKELTAGAPQEERNWRGIGIAVLVIFVICALIVTSVFILSPGASKGRPGSRLTLDDVTSGRLRVRKFNGSWISGTELTYTDSSDNVVIFNVITGNKSILITNIIYDPIYGILSIYKIMDTRSRHVHPLLRSLDGKNVPRLQNAQWGPRDNQLLYVDRFQMYYVAEYGQRPDTLLKRTADNIYNAIPERSYRERILKRDNAIWWSKDGNRLCYATFDVSQVNRSSYFWYGGSDADSDASDSSPVTPTLLNYPYFKPGTSQPHVFLYVADLRNSDSNHDQVVVPREIMFRDYYLTGVVWVNEKRLAINWMVREQNQSIISICDEMRNKWVCEKTLDESNPGSGWVDPFENPLFSQDGLYYFVTLPISGGAAGNFKHLAMVPINDPRAKTYLTYGSYDVTAILGYNEERGVVYYQATLKGKAGQRHIFGAEDATRQIMSISRSVVCLTCNLDAECLYNSAIFSPGALFYVLTCGGPRIPRIEARRTADNHLVTVLERNEHLVEFMGSISVPASKSYTIPLLGGVEGRVKLFLPIYQNDLETNTRYPLLVHACEEPASQCVSEEFTMTHWASQLAHKRNYIYARMDGRGSSFSGDKRAHSVYRQLGIPETSDYIQAVKYLKKEVSFIDHNAIAIFGSGYGGHLSLSILAEDDTTFSCAIALSPITNWRHYDAVFSEKFLGGPGLNDNFVGYEMSELSRKAENFRGKKLLLVHGLADENVQVHQTLFLAKELVKSGVPFMQQLYPDEGHDLTKIGHFLKYFDKFSQECFKSGDELGQEDKHGPVRTRVLKNG